MTRDVTSRYFQFGRETTAGVAVTPNRRWPGTDFGLQRSGAEPEASEDEMTGRFTVRRTTRPVHEYSWDWTGGLNCADAVDWFWLLADIDQSPTPPVELAANEAYEWRFFPPGEEDPDGDLNTGTIFWDARGETFQGTGCILNELSIEGSAAGGDTVVSLSGMARTRTVGTSAPPAATIDPSPVVQGWEGRVNLVELPDDPSTVMAGIGNRIVGACLSYSLTFVNNPSTDYRFDNTPDPQGFTRGRHGVTGSLVVDLDYNHTNGVIDGQAAARRYMMWLTLGGQRMLSGTTHERVAIQLPIVLTSQDVPSGGEDGTSTLALDWVHTDEGVDPAYEVYIYNDRSTF